MRQKRVVKSNCFITKTYLYPHKTYTEIFSAVIIIIIIIIIINIVKLSIFITFLLKTLIVNTLLRVPTSYVLDRK